MSLSFHQNLTWNFTFSPALSGPRRFYHFWQFKVQCHVLQRVMKGTPLLEEGVTRLKGLAKLNTENLAPIFIHFYCDDWLIYFSGVLIDGRLLCVSQVLGGHLFRLPAHADDGLGAVCGRLCKEAGARERAKTARGDAYRTITNPHPASNS